MNPLQRAPRPRSAFTLLELVIVLALIAALAGVVTVRSGKFVQRGQVSSLVQLAGTLKTACAAFHADTGTYPREYDMASYSGTSLELSSDQSLSGWDGPYLEKGITESVDNPFGPLHLYDSATGAGNSGFDLDADGTDDVASNCSMLYLGDIPPEVAEQLDEHFDAGVGGNRYETGRFNWNSSNNRAYVLVYH